MEFKIHSSSSDRVLVLSDREADYFRASLVGDITTGVRVYSYQEESHLIKFFDELGNRDKPWEGKLTWESLEGELTISAICSPLGQVTFEICMYGNLGSQEAWQLKAGIDYDFGQLAVLTKSINKFL